MTETVNPTLARNIGSAGNVTWGQSAEATATGLDRNRSLLLAEDDPCFSHRLARALELRGFAVTNVCTVADALVQVEDAPPAFAVVDLRLADGSGLDVISAITKRRPDARAVVLTGYGSIATAVDAVKRGAVNYLSKPVHADDIAGALMSRDHDKVELPERPMSANRVRWEHIQRIYELCGRNVSESARRLNMHRRTLQRVLAKRAPQ